MCGSCVIGHVCVCVCVCEDTIVTMLYVAFGYFVTVIVWVLWALVASVLPTGK